MKTQSVVLLLCGLIYSSYGSVDQQVSVGCTNQATGLIYIINPTLNVSVVVETSTAIAAIFNGNTGEAVCYDTTAKTGQYVASTAWLASKESIQAHLTGYTSLQSVCKSATYSSITLSTITTSLYESFTAVLGGLSTEIAISSYQSSDEVAFAYFLAIADSLCTSLDGNTVLTLIDAEPTKCDGGIVWLTSVFQGLTTLFSTTQLALEDFIGIGVQFSLTDILGATNGVECLNVILTSIHQQIDLGISLGSTLNDLETFFDIVALLGGKASTQESGAYSILADVIQYINKHGELNDINENLIAFSIFANASIDVLTPIGNLIATLNTSSALYGSSVDITALVTILSAFTQNSATLDGINLSNILKWLEQGATDSSAAELVLNVLIELESLVSIYESIPQLVLSAVKLYNNTKLFLPDTFNCSYSSGQDTMVRRSLFDSLTSIVSDLLDGVLNSVQTVTDTLSELLNIQITISNDSEDITSVNGKRLATQVNAISNAVCQLSEGRWNLENILKNCSVRDIYRQTHYWVEIYLSISIV